MRRRQYDGNNYFKRLVHNINSNIYNEHTFIYGEGLFIQQRIHLRFEGGA